MVFNEKRKGFAVLIITVPVKLIVIIYKKKGYLNIDSPFSK